MPLTTTQEQPTLEQYAARALQAILTQGHAPTEANLAALAGEVKECIEALAEALQRGGVEAARQAFLALSKDRPWLTRLAAAATDSEGTEQKPGRRIRFLPLSEFLDRPAQQWLIAEVLPRDGLALVYGESGGYKSFLVMDWSFCMATGTPWLGRRVTHGPVAYIAAEGGYGIGKRATAWLVHHERFFRTRQELNQQVPLRLYDKSIILQEPSHVAELLTALQEDFPEEPPVLVVIDTLSRCSPGAEEVSNTDMALVLASADAVREQFHCTVLIVHHEGKDKERGPRGASALLANIETAILVTPIGEGFTRVESIKAKDAPRFPKVFLQTKEVRFGPQPDDSSLVLIQSNEQEEEVPTRRPESQVTILGCLAGKQLTFEALKQACLDVGQKENTFKKAFGLLNKEGAIVKIGKLWQIPQDGEPEQETSDIFQ